MPCVGFEPTIPASEQEKQVYAATVIGAFITTYETIHEL
jgi:hypothetical protein